MTHSEMLKTIDLSGRSHEAPHVAESPLEKICNYTGSDESVRACNEYRDFRVFQVKSWHFCVVFGDSAGLAKLPLRESHEDHGAERTRTV
jgi:hypothetical protein